ncbi:MAG: hypothetical protein KL787_02470 [Taibaiella sp.]|nr:hypothetical protein [Taibaiella sp.]
MRFSERSVSLYQHLGIVRKEDALQGSAQEKPRVPGRRGCCIFSGYLLWGMNIPMPASVMYNYTRL